MLSKEAARKLVGSVSCGTLRPKDLGEAMVSLLDNIGEAVDRACARILVPASEADCLRASRWNGRKDDLCGEWERADDETRAELVDEMIALANEALPAGFCCEMHPGDGADLGIWESGED